MKLAIALILGGGLATAYFVGLWCTVSHLPQARHPLIVYFGSLLLRLAAVVAAVWLLLQLCEPPLILVFGVGFLAVRAIVVRRLGACLA